MGDRREECGIAGILLKDDSKNSNKVVRYLERLLGPIQDRGQDGTGITVYSQVESGEYKNVFRSRKKLLLVEEFFVGMNDILNKFLGTSGIGHLRYGTSGQRGDSLDSVQPFTRRHEKNSKTFSIAYNGNLANYVELEKELKKKDFMFQTGVDTEIIMHLYSSFLDRVNINKRKNGDHFFEIWEKLAKKLDGAYSVVNLFGNGNMGVVRDPDGFKPLVWGENKEFYVVASESISLRNVGIDEFNIVEPGSAMIFSKNGIEEKRISEQKRRSHCHFEGVYFMQKGSHFENQSVYLLRERLGRGLAIDEPLANKIREMPEKYIVVPVPDSANPAAESFANFFKIPYKGALEKIVNKRGFIHPDNERGGFMDKKYSIIREIIEGKRVFLIEDSTVRGDTLKRIVKFVNKANVEEMHIRSTEPPIIGPCFYGTNIPTYDELIANRFIGEGREEDIAKELGATSFRYQSIDGLLGSFDVDSSNMCLACINGKYSTKFGKKRASELIKDK